MSVIEYNIGLDILTLYFAPTFKLRLWYKLYLINILINLQFKKHNLARIKVDISLDAFLYAFL